MIKSLCLLPALLLVSLSGEARNIDLQGITGYDFGPDRDELTQKFRMADYLLGSEVSVRIRTHGREPARKLLQKAESNFEFALGKARAESWLEANAVIDSVLRDLTNSATMLNAKSASQNKYEETLRRVDGFVYPDWKDLSDHDRSLLDKTTTEINLLHEQATSLARQDQYDEATEMLLKIYSLKSQLLQRLDHDSTIVYDLMFETADEEYDYLSKRRAHYQELLDDILALNSFDEPIMKLVHSYLAKSDDSLNKAGEMKHAQAHKRASQLLEQSIKEAIQALKILGVKI